MTHAPQLKNVRIRSVWSWWQDVHHNPSVMTAEHIERGSPVISLLEALE